ncbi:MAG: protein translocase subunit SecF [Pseudomonadota bacterium]
MEFFKKQSNIDFMQLKSAAFAFSLLLCLISAILVGVRGINYGLDFTGGTQIECRFAQAVVMDDIRHTLEAAGINAKLSLIGSAQDVLIRLPVTEAAQEKTVKHIVSVLQADHPGASLRRVEYVGAEVGEDLAYQGGIAVLMAVIGMMCYIALRFEYRFAVSAAVALLHDPIVILGVFAALQIEFDMASLAGILAILGYSLNDTIVVYDRVRENFRKIRSEDAAHIMNLSINQTLSRTIMTSFLTLLVVVALLLVGGDSLRGFSTAFFVGILVGTYSSIYVAGALALVLGLSRKDLLPTPKFVDNMP